MIPSITAIVVKIDTEPLFGQVNPKQASSGRLPAGMPKPATSPPILGPMSMSSAVGGVSSGRTNYVAYLVANPSIYGYGATEEEAIATLKQQVINPSVRGSFRKIVEITLEDLVAEEVMEG